MKPSRIQAVEHAHLQAPFGTEEALAWFYGELCGLDMPDGDDPQPGPDAVIRFKSALIELRVQLMDNPVIDSTRRRLTLAIPDLAAAAELLDERRIPYARLSGMESTDRRLSVLDPAGNRIELKQTWSLL